MKKLLNGLGVFSSIILTIILTALMFLYTIILNVKFIVSEKGMSNTLKKIDIVETLKNAENGTVWEDFKQLANNLNLSETQFEQILNSEKVKEEISSYINEIISTALNDKTVVLTDERMEQILNIVVDEYNKVSETKISETKRQEIISSFDEEMIANINEEFSSINLQEVAPEYAKYIELTDNILFGNYDLIILAVMLGIIILIALFRFSYYKWMPYVESSTIISGIILLFIGVLLLIVPLPDMEIFLPIKKIIITNIMITSLILFIISVGLSIGKKYLKRYIKKQNPDEDINQNIKEKGDKY